MLWTPSVLLDFCRLDPLDTPPVDLVYQVRKFLPFALKDNDTRAWILLKTTVVVGMQQTRMPAVISTMLGQKSIKILWYGDTTYVVAHEGITAQVLSVLLFC